MQMKERIQAAYTKLKVHRWIAWLLCVALMVSMVSSTLPALAVNGENEEGTLCEHHPEHTEDCGYAEAVEGQYCTHIHDDECGYVGGGSITIECTHVHDEECGYVEAVEGKPCRFVCKICDESEEDLGEEIEQDVAVTADEPMALAAANEKGLIAEFRFDDESNRLRNSANSGVTASLHRVEGGQAARKEEITDLGNYFEPDDNGGNTLHLENNACLVLDHIDAFKGLNELTIEMRVNITSAQKEHWLFYATPDGASAANTNNCFGAVVRNSNKELRTIRNNSYQVNYSADEVLKLNEWHSIKIVYKVSTMALYIDGERVQEYGAGGRTADYFVDSTAIWLGHSAFTADTNFDGYMDDIEIYNYARDDHPIDEQKYIVESADPPNTTVHMFDYWITGQEENDYNPLSLDLDGVRNGKINNGHLLLFAGGDAANGEADSPDDVGSWNAYQYKDTVNGRDNHKSWEPFPGIVNNVLDGGYPQLAIEGLRESGMFKSPDDGWYERNADKADESLDYLFKPEDDVDNGKAAYPNVTGLFRLDEKGYYYFRCAKTFAELNRDQITRPKRSTGNNKITLYKRSTEYKDFFPFNDATDLFYINMDDELNKANVKLDGSPDMKTQATTDEPINHYFGMTVETTFEQTTDGKIDLPGGEKEDMNFHFSGDDDVWIFIDDVLVADVGGIHNEIDVNINFATGEVDFKGYDTTRGQTIEDNLDGKYASGSGKIFDTTLKKRFEEANRYDESEWNPNNKELFADGSKHTLKFFYLERGNNVSRCTIEFNLQHAENDAEEHTHKNRSSSENVPVEPIFEEFVTLDVSTEELPKKKEETKEIGVLASPNTGDSNMVGLWLALLALSTAGLAAIHRTRRRGSK